MAHSRKHNPVPPTPRASRLIGMDVVTLWQRCSEAGERHYSTMCFSTEEPGKGRGLPSGGFLNFFLSISKCHVDENSQRPRFNTLQLCTAHFSGVPLCVNECSPSPQLVTLQLCSYNCVMYACVHASVTLSTRVCLTLHFVVATSQYDVELLKYKLISFFTATLKTTPQTEAHQWGLK